MLLSMYEAIHHIWIAETSVCNSSYEDFRWAWFVGMYVQPHTDVIVNLARMYEVHTYVIFAIYKIL